MRHDFDIALMKFLDAAQEGLDAVCPVMQSRISVKSQGVKNLRIVQRREAELCRGSESVYCFIDKETGDILKAASFKSAAKGARGNIFDPESYKDARTDPYGGWLYLWHKHPSVTMR